jgi:hypothetical protein
VLIPVAAGVLAGAMISGLAVRKGSRTAPPPQRTPAAVSKATPAISNPAPTIAAVIPPAAPEKQDEPLPPLEKPSPFQPKPRTMSKPATVRPAGPAQLPPTANGSAARTEPAPPAAVVVHGTSEPSPEIAAAPVVPPAPLAPITTPARIEQPKRITRQAIVTVEPVSGSKIGRVVGHIPGLGRLRKASKGFVPARPIRQITPTVPQDEQLDRDIPVDVHVMVDPAGNVASVDARGGDKELSRVAEEAARSWQFVPARRNDESVSSELILHFTFKGNGSAQP